MTRRARRRGFILVPVLVLAVVFLLVIETSLTLLTTSLRDSHRREAALDARHLALSGLEWGEACVAARHPQCGDTLGLAGGLVVVSTVRGPGVATVRAEGRVLRGGKVLASHVLTRRVTRPLDDAEPEGAPAPESSLPGGLVEPQAPPPADAPPDLMQEAPPTEVPR